MKQTPLKAAPVKKRRRKAGPLCWVIALGVIAAFGFFLYELIALDILPLMYLVLILMGTMLLTFFILFFWLLKTRRPITRWIFGILAVAMGVVYGVGGSYLGDTAEMLADVTNLTDKMGNVVSVYGLISNKVEKPKDLDGGVLGVVSALDPEGTEGIVNQLKSQGVKFTTKEYDDPYTLVYDCINGKVDGIALPEQLHDAVYEAANDENRLNMLTTVTNIVDQYVYYTDRPELMDNKADAVGNVMTQPFTVLISGNDSYGTLGNVSRSDVNMLAVVNPKTAEVLLLSLPRDTYLPITCKKNPSACEAGQGMEDKLTHSGLYGVATTESSIEDFMDIDINYTVRINFSSLINIVDAMGGVTVTVDKDHEVETFYSNGTEGVKEGPNLLNGERALAFARERYAYADGDNQRVRNQQILLKALIQQMMNPAMVVKYPAVMKALSTAFETNMSTRELKSLLTLEISKFPKWNIQTFALDNEPDNRYSPAAGANAAVTIADPQQVSYARSLIQTVLEGGTPNLSSEAQEQAASQSETSTSTESENEASSYGDSYSHQEYTDPNTDESYTTDTYEDRSSGTSIESGTYSRPSESEEEEDSTVWY